LVADLEQNFSCPPPGTIEQEKIVAEYKSNLERIVRISEEKKIMLQIIHRIKQRLIICFRTISLSLILIRRLNL
jgi:biotin-(acetyl-CoA carboxylase) ligase